MTDRELARVCYEANRAFGIALGEAALPHWEHADTVERDAWIEVSAWLMADPTCPNVELHEQWMRVERKLGWSWGPELDNARKQHPHHVPWHALPPRHQDRIAMMRVIGWTLTRGRHERCANPDRT